MPTANVTTSSTAVIAAGPRRVLMLQNISDTDIYIRLTGTAVTIEDGANAGLMLPANGGMTSFPDLPADERFGGNQTENDNAVYAIHGGSGTKTLRYEIL